MPTYEFRCPECRTPFTEYIPLTEYDSVELSCPECIVPLNRVFSSPGVVRDMPGHFNNSAGKYVPNMRSLKDEFKRMGEAYSERTGMTSDFQVIDSQEVSGLSTEGLDSTFKAKGMTDTAALERRIDQSAPPKAVRKPRALTGGWEKRT